MPLSREADARRKREQRVAARSDAVARRRAAIQAVVTQSTSDWISGLVVPPGAPRAGLCMSLDLWQTSFIENALAEDTREALLCTARKNGKTALTAALALSYLAGPNHFPGAQIVCASISLEHIAELQKAALALADANDIEIENQKTPRPGHLVGMDGAECRFVSGSTTSALSTQADIAIFDELGTLPESKRTLIEHLKASLSGRNGKFLALSIRGNSPLLQEMVEAAKSDPSIYCQLHEGNPADNLEDVTNWQRSNPGLASGIKSLDFMRHAARQAVQNPKLEPTFRALHLNEGLMPDRTPIVTISQWQACLTDELPPRQGGVVVGIDAGGADSFSAACFYWPQTGRTESFAVCGGIPDALARSRHDGVGDLYAHAVRRNELQPQPDNRSVDLEAFMQEVCDRLDGQRILCMVGDRYKMGEIADAMQRCGVAAPFIARGVGYKDSTPDISAFQRYVDSGKLKHRESLLMAHAIGSSFIMQDDALNQKLSKLKANKSKTDILQAAVLAIGQAARIEQSTPKRKRRRHSVV